MNNITRVKPVVSFCIPVYNKAEVTETLVKGILCSDNPNFEVVISDNASDDNTKEVLSRITDHRLKYYRSSNKIDARENWLRSLELGRGEWLFLVMSRDKIHGENADNLIRLLEQAAQQNITYIEDGYSNEGLSAYYSGIAGVNRFIRRFHPTGSIFRGDIFRSIPNKIRYFKNSDMYPENYLRRDVLLKGYGASIISSVFRWGDFLVDFTKIQSTLDVSRNIFDLFFAPKHLILQYFEMIDMIDELSEVFSKRDMDLNFKRKFMMLLKSISYGWCSACQDPVLCSHYGVSVRHVSAVEMLKNIFTACRQTRKHLKAKGSYSFKRQIIMLTCMAAAIVKLFAKWFFSL